MGAAYSSRRQRRSPEARPSRHAWTRIQAVDHDDSQDEEEDDGDNDEWWVGDRRVIQDERSDWPRSCPILHLNIQKDFPLDAQRRLVRSCYRFWLFSWWISVINFVAVMATLLTSNVTNPSAMMLSFMLSIVYLFSVFFLYFRPLYWALRLESNVLFVWFYIMSFVLLAFVFYQITQALGLVSILAEPLSPGSNLPVKVNPIFPVTLFTLVVVFYVFCVALIIYYFSAAVKWHRMSDRDKMKMYKQQNKKKWLAPWFGGKGGGDDDLDDLDDDDDKKGEKPRFSFHCILSYEKARDDYVDDVLDPRVSPKERKRRLQARRERQKSKNPHDSLTIPGTVNIFPSQRKVVFRANEAIFGNLFKLDLMIINITSIKTSGDTWLEVIEKENEGVMDDDMVEYKTITPTCSSDSETIRTLKFDFETRQDRNQCNKEVDRLWRAVKKQEQLYILDDEETLRRSRIEAAAKLRERAAQHLLTHKDWKLLVSFVWRKEYHAGKVILHKGSTFSDIMYITKGKVSIHLETTETARDKLKQKEDELNEDVDLAGLFPETEKTTKRFVPTSSELNYSEVSPTRPSYYTVTFEQRKLGFAYRIAKRSYNIDEFLVDDVNTGRTKRVMPDNMAAIVHSVKPGSQAEKKKVQVNDELVKIGVFDIEANNLTQRSITNLIKSHSFPMTLEFRRPPKLEFEEDDQGFVTPNHNLVPQRVRDNMLNYEMMDGPDDSSPPQVVLGANAYREPSDDEESSLLLGAVTPGNMSGEGFRSGYVTSDEDTEDDDYDEGPYGASYAAAPRGDTELIAFSETGAAAGVREAVRSMVPDVPPQQVRTVNIPGRGGPGSEHGSYVPPQLGGQQHQQPLLAESYHQPPALPARSPTPLSALELAENFAARSATNADNRQFKAVGDDMVEFDAGAPTIEQLEQDHRIEFPARSVSFDFGAPPSAPETLLERGRRFLFGRKIEYNKLEEDRLREDLRAKHPMESNDEISVVVGGQSKVDVADDDSDSDVDSLSDYFSSIKMFEPVGTFERGDTIGIIPWILHQEVSVVQLKAETDVVIHSIDVMALTKLFRKNGSLALAFFKYVAAVVGERADRDEELLCDQIEKELLARGRKSSERRQLTRLLDRKPIRTTGKTGFEQRGREMERAREFFESDFDMAFDDIILQMPCTIHIIGDISVLVGESWYGVDTRDSDTYKDEKLGILYLTHYYVCFRTKKRALDLAKLKRRPTLYGKLHINDIYDVQGSGDTNQKITITTDDLRLEVYIEKPGQAAMVRDWINALINSDSVAERAPHSYTLPGDSHGFSSGTQDENLPKGIEKDPLNMVYTQQHDLRTEFRVLTQTLQQVLTKKDRYQLFRNGSSVKLKRGQNVLTASRFHSKSSEDIDPDHKRRTTTSKKSLMQDGPNGLYLIGDGDVVVQREVNGRRIIFATYTKNTVFGVERFLTGAPSPFTIKVSSETALLKFAPRERCMALLRSDLALAARFYQYCALLQMQRLRGPILSRPQEETDNKQIETTSRGSQGCVIL